MNWVQNMRSGSRHALARLISKIENRDAELPRLVAELYPLAGKARVWGITGPPGAGKSTLVDQMTRALRKRGKRVAIVAVDPSSPFSGGAILGDRVRMQDHAGDPGVYIRSLGTRGQHGGLSLATKEVVLALDAAGFDTILVETAGVGQTELAVLQVAHSVMVVLVPESGDSIQVMKAGLMEIADVFAVNKSDRPEADKLVKELITLVTREGVEMFGGVRPDPTSKDQWLPPVLKTRASDGTGVEAVLDQLERHSDYLTQSGRRTERFKASLKDEVAEILAERVRKETEARWWSQEDRADIEALVRREIDPYELARRWSVPKGAPLSSP